MKRRASDFNRLTRALWLLLLVVCRNGFTQTTSYVSITGNDTNPGTLAAPWRTIQKAANVAAPGTTVLVQPGTYNEKVTVNVSGSAAAGFVTFQATSNVVVSGSNVAGANLFYLLNCSYVRLTGFELRDNLGVSSGAGVWIEGGGDHLEIRSCKIHNIRGTNAMGVTVYGTSLTPLSNVVVDSNEIFDCDAAASEALTLDGNVTNFLVTSNYVHDVNNIGIDMIGGEGVCPDPAQDAARGGVCCGNRVERARSIYGGGFAAGIYVDGGRDIFVENNIVTQCDLGIEVGAEHTGINATNITVRNNVIYANDKVGLVFGGFSASVGRTVNSRFLNNTCWKNDTLSAGYGELSIQFASNNVVKNNLLYCGAQNRLLSSASGAISNTLDFNLWFSEAGSNSAVFSVRGIDRTGFTAYRQLSLQDASSLFANPLLVAPANADFHLATNSPARDAGDPAFVAGVGEADLDGQFRVFGGRVDIGADEVPVQPALQPPARQGNGQFLIRLTGETNRNYEVQATRDFVNWLSLGTNNSPSGTLDFLDAPGGLTSRSYRAVVRP